MAVSPDGTVFAIDTHGRVVNFTSTGAIGHEYPVPVAQGTTGSRIVAWGDLLAVTSQQPNGLSLIDLQVGLARTAKFTGQQSLTLTHPAGLAASPDGPLYVLDGADNHVVALEKAP